MCKACCDSQQCEQHNAPPASRVAAKPERGGGGKGNGNGSGNGNNNGNGNGNGSGGGDACAKCFNKAAKRCILKMWAWANNPYIPKTLTKKIFR